VPEHVTLKAIHHKREKFFKLSLILTLLTVVLFIAAGVVLFSFWYPIMFAVIIILVASTTFRLINRLYVNKITSSRNDYIQALFPIKDQLTQQQSQFILNDLAYMFDGNETVLDQKLRTNNLSAKDMERINILYSKYFIDLTTIHRKS
jgi:hypothetical protein